MFCSLDLFSKCILVFDIYVNSLVNVKPELWTYGSPRVGNDVFASFVNNTFPTRYKLSQDIEPDL